MRKILWLTLLLLVACQSPDPDLPPTLSPMRQEVEDAFTVWESHAITNYSMRVTYNHAGWAPQILDIIVNNDEVELVEQSCIPERDCGLRPIEASDFSLASIYQAIQPIADQQAIMHIVYHDEYGFPRLIQASPDSWTITDFQPLDE